MTARIASGSWRARFSCMRIVGGRWQCLHMGDAWQPALREVAARLNRADVGWLLVGSAATAVRGAPIQPGDIDIAMSTPSAVHVAAALLPSRGDDSPSEAPTVWYSSVRQPVLSFTDAANSEWTFGRWTLYGVKVELAHITRPGGRDLCLEGGFSRAVWEVRSVLDWNGVQLTVVPIELQLVTMVVRNQIDRIEATLAAIGPQGIDQTLLRRAITDRRIDGADLRIPTIIQRLLTEPS